MTFQFEAELKTKKGTGASRRLRLEGKLPAIIYGGDAEPVAIVLDHNQLNHAQEHDEFYTSDLTIKVGDKTEVVRIQAMQRHPTKPKLIHLDFKRV